MAAIPLFEERTAALKTDESSVANVVDKEKNHQSEMIKITYTQFLLSFPSKKEKECSLLLKFQCKCIQSKHVLA